jgi:hypothetical protein
MHYRQLYEITCDAEVGTCYFLVVLRRHLTEAQTQRALIDLNIPRAASVAKIAHRAYAKKTIPLGLAA